MSTSTSEEDTIINIEEDCRCIEDVQLSFRARNIEYTIKTSNEDGICGKGESTPTTIISGIDCDLKSGSALAIMGPSGSGKTTLLNILSGKVKPTNGQIFLEGTKTNSCSYVPQTDVLPSSQTVREAMYFYANLRLNRKEYCTLESRTKKADELIEKMGMARCVDTLIGNEMMKGISGGEKRRLSIAVELLNNPKVLLLDEPTSGLDATMAFEVMKYVIDLSKEGMAIAFTIHQPRSGVFAMFDDLLLLSQGRMVYKGPSYEALEYFDSRGYICDEYTNPADFFLDVLSRNGDKLCSSYEPVYPLKEPLDGDSNGSTIIKDQRNTSNFFTQMQYVLKRDFYDQLRNPVAFRVQIAQVLFTALFMALIFLRLGDDQAGVISRQGALTFLFLCQSFTYTMSMVHLIPRERILFYRERDSDTYFVSVYYLSKVLIQIPSCIILPTLFSLVSYWAMNLHSGAEYFFIHLWFLILTYLVSSAQGIFTSAMFDDISVGTIVCPLICMVSIAFGGVFLNIDSIPIYFIWVPYISYVRWAFDSLIHNEFVDTTWECDSDQSTCFETGQEVIDSYNYGDTSYWLNSMVLIGLFFAFNFTGFIALYIKDRRK